MQNLLAPGLLDGACMSGWQSTGECQQYWQMKTCINCTQWCLYSPVSPHWEVPCTWWYLWILHRRLKRNWPEWAASHL